MAKLISSAGAVVASLGFCCVLLLAAVVLAGTPGATAAAAAADDDGGGVFESTVFELVQHAIRGNSTVPGNPRVGPALLRLLFHDCWVNGCDGSVLLDETPTDGTSTEKKASKSIGLAGFDLIDKIKSELLLHLRSSSGGGAIDASCADILAFAARDAASILSGGRIRYEVRRGRRDGVTSSAAAADAQLPSHSPAGGFAELAAGFAARGFGKRDLAALAGAHAVGVSHSSSFAPHRLLPSAANAGQINGTYQLALAARLQMNSTAAAERMTTMTTTTMSNNVRDTEPEFRAAASYSGVGVDTSPAARNTLDNSYYTASLQNMVLLRSDWELTQDEDTLASLVEYRDDGDRWRKDFGDAMERLSELRPPAGANLEIRNNCRRTNHDDLISPGRAVVRAVRRFFHRRHSSQMSCLFRFFNAAAALV